MLFDFSSFLHLSSGLDFSHLLAQAATDGQVASPEATADCFNTMFTQDRFALSCGSKLSAVTAQHWDTIWDLKVNQASPEFISMMNISRYIAGPAVALWGITAIKDLHRNGFADGWQRLAAIVMLVFVLYGNNAKIMRTTTLAMRSLINYQNQLVLEVTNQDAIYEDRLAEIIDFNTSRDKLQEFRGQCNGKTDNKAFLDCLVEANAMADQAIEVYKTEHAGGKFIANLEIITKQLIKDHMDFAVKALAGGVAGGATGAAIAISGDVVNNSVTMAANGILASMNYVAQNVVELTWLFTAIIVPIPLALSFYPGGRTALIGWTVGFLTVGLFKINLNIATSLIVAMIYERGPGAGNIDLMLLSLGSIFIATLMTAGGGMTIFNGLMTGITTVAAGSMKLFTQAATTAAGAIL